MLQLSVCGVAVGITADLRNGSRSRGGGHVHLNICQVLKSSFRLRSQFHGMYQNSAGLFVASCKIFHHAQSKLCSPGLRPQLLALFKNHTGRIETFVPDEFHCKG